MKSAAAVFLLIVLLGATTSASQPSASDVVDLYEAAISSLYSYDVVLTLVETRFVKTEVTGTTKTADGEDAPTSYRVIPLAQNEQHPSKPRVYRQIRQRGLARIEYLDPTTMQPTSIRVASREAEKVLAGRTSGSIGSPSSEFAPDGADYEQFFRSDYGKSDLTRVIRSRKVARKFTVIENGTEMPGFDVPPEPMTDFSRYGFRVVLDPKNGLMPCLIERYQMFDGKPVTIKRTALESYRRVRGVIVPVAARTTLYFGSTGSTQGVANLERQVRVDVGHSSWNVEIPASTFQLTFPAGMPVRDRWRNVTLPAGNTDAQKHLEALAADASRIVPKVQPDLATRGSAWEIGKIVLYVAAGMVILLASAALLYSRARRK